MSMFDDLNLEDPIVKGLAEKYQVPTTVIAYLRAALMRTDNKYDKQSLMYHIIEENQERKKEIGALRLTITEENVESIKAQITNIQRKMDFRQGVLAVLRTVDEAHLRDILRTV